MRTMLHTEIASMVPGETFTYHTDEIGGVWIHSHLFDIPSGSVDTGLRYRYGATNVEHELLTAPKDSYTAVLCQGGGKFATRTFTAGG